MINLPKLTGLAREIFLSKYAAPGELEWEDCAKRVSKTIAQAENENSIEWQQKFYEVIESQDFVPAGRILYGSGRPRQNLLNCFVLDPQDNIQDLAELLKNVYLVSTAGGGLGFNWSAIRVKGDPIQSIKFCAPGTISEMRKIDAIAREVKGGKNRRSALMSVLNITHPDILEFIHVKMNLNELNNFNISIGINDDFINAVEKNNEWYFTFNNKKYYVYDVDRISINGNKETIQLTATDEEDAIGRAYGFRKKEFTDKFENARKIELKAKDLWNKIIENAYRCGEPGLINLSMMNFTNVSYFETIQTSNPCQEANLPNGGSCCLGSINLSNMIDEKKNDIDWKKLTKTINVAVRFLDNTLTVNSYPIPFIREVSTKSRRIGLGILGLHHALLKLGYRYGDETCLKFLERMMSTFRNEVYMASINIAKEKGVFPAFDAEKYLSQEFAKTLPQRIRRAIRKFGIRNATIIAIAPTGTISIICENASSGIEPIYSPIYERSYRDPQDPRVYKTTLVVDKLFKQLYQEGKNLDHVVGCYDITPEQHLASQATLQKFVDGSISKTCNLPQGLKIEEISSLLLEFIRDIKGVTIFQDNSRENQPLKAVKIKNDKHLKELIERAEDGGESFNKCKDGKCEI